MDRSTEIIASLARLETKMDALTEIVSNHVKEDHVIFHGEGPKEGLLIEHSKLMSSYRLWRTIFGTITAAVVATLADLVRRHW